MAAKKVQENEDTKKIKIYRCGPSGPGPTYHLRPVVGYNKHCQTKPRYPAYSLGIKTKLPLIHYGPGPIYSPPERKRQGISIGRRTPLVTKQCTPGFYDIRYPKCPKCPGFTIKSRRKPFKTFMTPGPYALPDPPKIPTYTIGKAKPVQHVRHSPGPYDVKFTLTKPASPKFSIGKAKNLNKQFVTPGPSYLPKYKARPMSFGIKHHECSRPYITEADDDI